ncbi:MAG: threonine-phosphate decarboxylase [Rhodobacteraceae bacterium]|nr:threonine-phosphate decarboxylase [Paracoccaceae bacterium]
MSAPRDHGGNLDAAIARWGGARRDWIDLSTGINRVPYPVGNLDTHAWTALPSATDVQNVINAARGAYRTTAEAIPLSGAQAAIQLAPLLRPVGVARILTPTYNEHAASFRNHGWEIEEVEGLGDLPGADAAVVVNPNNPDGAQYTPDALRDLAATVGLLIVDESFADPNPALSIAADIPENVLVLRSFGKFYGLAGVRLGFALSHDPFAARIRALAGPWAASGPALAVGTKALRDTHWISATKERLAEDCERLDHLAMTAGWQLVGGTALFRTYRTPSAQAAQIALAEHRIWSRIFPYDQHWIRLGLPAPEDWARIETALAGQSE